MRTVPVELRTSPRKPSWNPSGVFSRSGRKPAVAPSETSTDLLPSLVRGYGRLVLAPKDPRARTFTGRMERLADEAGQMADDPGFRARAHERVTVEVEEFAQAQRVEIERTMGALQDGVRRTANHLEDTLRAGDAAAGTMATARSGLGALDRVTSFEELRTGLDAEMRRLDEAIRLHKSATAQSRDALKNEVAHLRERLGEARDLASRDSLTGLANRAEFERQLGAVTLPERYVVAVIDLDGFKPINDCYGHGAGDRALTEFAGRLVGTVGEHGFAARIGGDEFALLVEDSEAHLITRLRTLELSLKECPVTLGDIVLPLGMSFGTAPFERGDPSRAVGVADGRMYLYKRAKGAQRAA